MNIKIYQSGLKYMFVNACKRLFNTEVIFRHSLDFGIYATLSGETTITEVEVNKIKEYMKTMVGMKIPFHKKVVSKKEAYDFYKGKNQLEKADNILVASANVVSLFEFEGQYNYFYSHDMPHDSGELPHFDIFYIGPNEVVLVYPYNGTVSYTFRKKIYESFKEYKDWTDRLGITYVHDLNKMTSEGKILDLIEKNNLQVDITVYEVSKAVIENKKRIVLMAGPSSSGKTTTSRKLDMYLESQGYKALPLSLDDFFLERKDTPIGEDGKPDFESINCVDLNLFSTTLNKLMSGEEVYLPTFDFVTGEKVFDDFTTKIDEHTIIIIEGLHAINPKLIEMLDINLIYKVYISPLTPLNVDRHNYVSTTDNRLLRRIIRDFRTRGRTAEQTIASWESVRRGEEKHIFPFTDTVDAIINTAYIYELGVLKVYVEPLLYHIDMDSPYYYEARRLLDSLRTFFPISSEFVSHTNLLREFIGGSAYEEAKR